MSLTNIKSCHFSTFYFDPNQDSANYNSTTFTLSTSCYNNTTPSTIQNCKLLTDLTLGRTPLLHLVDGNHEFQGTRKIYFPFFHKQSINCNSNFWILSSVFFLGKSCSHLTCCNCRSQSPKIQVMRKLEEEQLSLFWTGNETPLYPRIEKW